MQDVKKTQRIKSNIIPFIPDGDFYFTKGVEAFQKRKFDIALKWLKKAVEKDPTEPLFQCQMSIIYTELGSFHEANQLLTQVLQTSGDQYADCYYLLANNYAHLGLFDDAKRHVRSYLDIEPDGDFSEEAASLLQYIKFEAFDDDYEYEDDDEDNLSLDDDLIIYQEAVLQCMEYLEWEKALTLLEEMMILFPENTSTKHDLAQALFFSGHEKEAVQLELDLLKEDPDELYSHANLAVFYYEMEHEEYKNHIGVLLNVYPIQTQQKLRIAVTLARTGYFAEAYARFRSLVKVFVNSYLSYYIWYSHTAYQIGQSEKAHAIWKEGCKKHPDLSNKINPWDM